MNVSNPSKYTIPTVGPMRVSFRGWVWLAAFVGLPLALVSCGYLLAVVA